MHNLIAQVPNPLPGRINGIGPLVESSGATSRLAQITSSAIGLITVIAFVYFMFILISGAIGVISAGGDKGKLEDARSRITNGVIGVVIVVAGMFIVDLIARLLGIQGILNIEQMISIIEP